MAKYYLFPRSLSKRLPDLHPFGWWIEAQVVKTFVAMLRRRSLADATRLAHRVFRAVGPRTIKHKAVIRNLYVAFPDRTTEELDEVMRDVFGYLGTAFAELVHLDTIWREHDARLEFDASSKLAFLEQRGKPAVLVTAHVGPWTLTNFVAREYGFPLSIVYAPESNPRLRDLMYELRAALGVIQIERDQSIRALMQALARGETVGLGSDVRLDAGETLPFFGHDMQCNTVPARLALRYDCELVPVRAQRLPGGRFRITLEAPVRPSDPSASPKDQAADMTRQLNARFERWICDSPGEWMCLAGRWPKPLLRARVEARGRKF